jgi:hypothetical protein
LGGLAESLDGPVVGSFPVDGEGTEFFFGKIEGLLSEGESLLSESGVFEFIDAVINVGPVVSKAEDVGSLERRLFDEGGYSSDHFNWEKGKNYK